MRQQPIQFYVPDFGVVAKQSVKQGKGRYYTPPHIAENARALYWKAKRHAPTKPFVGPVLASYQFYIGTPLRKKWRTLKHTAGDVENLVKQVNDVLEAADFFAVGDGQIAGAHVFKFWAEKDGLRVTLVPVEVDEPIGCVALTRLMDWWV